MLIIQSPAGSRYCQQQSTSWPRLQKERAMDDIHTWFPQTATSFEGIMHNCKFDELVIILAESTSWVGALKDDHFRF